MYQNKDTAFYLERNVVKDDILHGNRFKYYLQFELRMKLHKNFVRCRKVQI